MYQLDQNLFFVEELFVFIKIKTKIIMKKEFRKEWGFATKLIHSGEEPDKETGAVAPILVRSKTFDQGTFGVEGEFQYSRGKNPTRQKLEEKLVELEGGGQATVYASGVAAEAAFFFTLSPGDHILCCNEVYGGTFRLLDQLLSRFGIIFDFVDFSNEKSIRSGIKPETKYLFVETPTNPSFHIIDLALVSKISKDTEIPFVVDATFSPPCALRSFEYGAETVIHSLSKYIAGHNDVIGGAIITKNAKLHERLLFLNRTIGAILSPDECYRVLQEVKTLDLRWKRASESALEVAKFLEKSLLIEKVLYPGLVTHPGHSVAKKQSRGGYGAALSFVIKNKYHSKLKKFIEVLRDHSPIVYGESLASPETIIAYPPLMSHKSLPKEVRESLGISDGFFRLSIGFEDPKDIIFGFEKAFKEIK